MTTVTKDISSIAAKAIALGFLDSDMIFDDASADSIFADDGTLHIRLGGTRICIDIGDDLTPATFRKKAKLMLHALSVDTSGIDVHI